MYQKRHHIESTQDLQLQLLLWSEVVCFILAFVLLGYLLFIFVGAQIYEYRAEVQISPTASGIAASVKPSLPIFASGKEGGLVGELRIRSLRLSVPILEGTSSRILRLGAGRVPGTAQPGGPGNVTIVGHRDTFFRSLRRIKQGDQIEIDTRIGSSVYQVQWIAIVSPEDTAVLQPTENASLTLMTCYPFHFLGAAPERFAVRARLLTGTEPAHSN